MLRPLLARIADGHVLSEAEAEAAFGGVMSGEATAAQLAALLMGLRMRGETVSELVGAARAMRAHMRTMAGVEGAVDVCGTGGDGHATLNVSTAVAFVLAALGVPVAKHGNRAVSSRAGASDTLQALGIPPEPDPHALEQSLRRHGLAFLSAPLHHPAMRHAAAVRAELGFRTAFNLLGPLCNPAGVRRQMLGVFDLAWQLPLARALRLLGTEQAWVVHGEDAGWSSGGGGPGLDEFGLAGPTRVVALRSGRLGRFSVEPADVGLPSWPLAAITGGDPVHNAAMLERLLGGEVGGAIGAYRDTVLLNAAAALQVSAQGHISGWRSDELHPDDGAAVPEIPPPLDALRDGLARAARAIDDGRAQAVLRAMRRSPDPR